MSSKDNLKYKVNHEYFTPDDFVKDCPGIKYVPSILPAVKRLIAIGDIHGDLGLAIRSFKLANLIDDKFNWIAQPPDTVVVQVGDQIDSCRPIPGLNDCHNVKYAGDVRDDMNVLEFFNKMHIEASKAGGAVYSLLGNHELMNAQGNFNYVSYENMQNFNYKQYQGPAGRKEAFKPGAPIANMLACTRPSILVVGSTLFVHAGLLPSLAKKLKFFNIETELKLDYLNNIVRKWLLGKLSEAEFKNYIMIASDKQESLFWTRIYGAIPENTSMDSSVCDNNVKKVLEVFQIGQMVIGHTPQMASNKSGINGTCYEKGKNTLYRIDGGFSHAFQVFGDNTRKSVQVLEIIDDQIFNILTDNMGTQGSIADHDLEVVTKVFSQNRSH